MTPDLIIYSAIGFIVALIVMVVWLLKFKNDEYSEAVIILSSITAGMLWPAALIIISLSIMICLRSSWRDGSPERVEKRKQRLEQRAFEKSPEGVICKIFEQEE